MERCFTKCLLYIEDAKDKENYIWLIETHGIAKRTHKATGAQNVVAMHPFLDEWGKMILGGKNKPL